MEDKRCAAFVDGKECGLPLTQVDREAGKIARYDLVTYACNLGHRSYFLLEPRIESQTFGHDPPRDRAKDG
jgi:hypothetical protein